jgi:hypothetical protein
MEDTILQTSRQTVIISIFLGNITHFRNTYSLYTILCLNSKVKEINKVTYQKRVIDPIYQPSTDRGTSFPNSPGLWICIFFIFFCS